MSAPGHRAIRLARAADLARLAEIERAADTLFAAPFGDPVWPDPPSGEERAAEGGLLLVAAVDSTVIGFAHVLEPPGGAHLEQLSVHPSAARHGHGTALVVAARAEAARRGHARLTLRTYADIPWNAPFYAACGFAIGSRDDAFGEQIMAVERGLGLERQGRRVWMVADVS